MKHSPLFQKTLFMKSLGKHFHKTFSRKIVSLSVNISDDLFKVIDHYFQIFRFPGCEFPIIPSWFSPFLFNFHPISEVIRYSSDILTLNFLPPLKNSHFLPLNLQKHLFPPKMPNSPLKWEWWRFLLHSPMGWTPLRTAIRRRAAEGHARSTSGFV